MDTDRILGDAMSARDVVPGNMYTQMPGNDVFAYNLIDGATDTWRWYPEHCPFLVIAVMDPPKGDRTLVHVLLMSADGRVGWTSRESIHKWLEQHDC